MTKITDVNIIASYDPVLTNKQEHIITAMKGYMNFDEERVETS